MTSSAYYNEHDPFAAAWLRELIKANLIVQGEVDERSILDVVPSDLRHFTQCHFFAGIGVWSYSLRQAGWADDREVWTGSCPCQPFSAAGKRGGTSDERHLWPSLYHLISELRPETVFGEQVASKDGLAWFSTVQTDLESAGFAVGGLDLCAAGFGAPHIRQRLYFVAHASANRRREERPNAGGVTTGDRTQGMPARFESSVLLSSVVNPESEQVGISGRTRQSRGSIAAISLGDSGSQGRQQECGSTSRHEETNGREGRNGSESDGNHLVTSPSESSFWGECDWLPCIDGKARPVEPGTFPLAHGITSRVGRLRGYGNALCAPVAQAFIASYMETLADV